MFQRLKSNVNPVVGLMTVMAVGLITFGAVASAAQDTSSDTVRPANIHVGSCDNLGEVAAELRDLVVMFDDDDDGGAIQDAGEFVGAADASVAEGSEDSDVAIGLDALLAEPHAIAVYESEGSDTVIACGTIGGYLRDDDDDDDDEDDDNELAIGLREQNDSGFAGVAILDDDDDDNELDVEVYVGREVAGDS